MDLRMIWDVSKVFMRGYFIQYNTLPKKRVRENTDYFG